MAIEDQVINSLTPTEVPGEGVFAEELQNQQLNTALASGTVDSILMKSDYTAVYDYQVVVKKDLNSYILKTELADTITASSDFDFGGYDSGKGLYIKSNQDPTSKLIPNLQNITHIGELAVDNYDGALYTRKRNDTNTADVITKIDAGSVNGFKVEKDVTSDTVISESDVRLLINSMFDYDSASNSLTITLLD